MRRGENRLEEYESSSADDSSIYFIGTKIVGKVKKKQG